MLSGAQQPAMAGQPPGSSWFMPPDFLGSPLASLASPDYRTQMAYARASSAGAASASSGGAAAGGPAPPAFASQHAASASPVRQAGLSSGHATAVTSAGGSAHQKRASVKAAFKSSDAGDGDGVSMRELIQPPPQPAPQEPGSPVKPRNAAAAAAAKMYAESRSGSPAPQAAGDSQEQPASQQQQQAAPAPAAAPSGSNGTSHAHQYQHHVRGPHHTHQQQQQTVASAPQQQAAPAQAERINLHGVWSKDLKVGLPGHRQLGLFACHLGCLVAAAAAAN
jgi:hypothetical protein